MRKIVAIAAALATCTVSFASLAQDRPAPPEPRPAPPAPPEVRPAPPEPRPAPPEPREGAGEKEFGNPGVLAIGGATGANFGYTSTSPAGGGSSTSLIDLSLAPDVQYFVIEGLSVGGTLLFDWKKPNSGSSETTFGIGPTVGYNIWLSPGSLSLWPQATFSFNSASLTVATPTGTASGTATIMNVGAFVPLLIHPVSHFHFGVGPYFDIDVSSKESSGGASVDGDKNMHVGIKLEVAGWL